jgi:outer membrane receptor for ferrienterochelin and colicin
MEASMHGKIRNSLYLVVLLLVNLMYAQSGTIKGIVIDETNGESLPGANIIIKGTSIGAASNIDGEFIIPYVPAGKCTLLISYIGYQKKELEVKIQPKIPVRMEIKLAPVVMSGETVSITAQAEGQVAAINQQLTAKTIINVVSEERLQEFPDINAAESIGRLPGVSIKRSGGEANKIVIRGLSDKFGKITLDHVQIPATDSDARGVDLSMISQSSLAGIELYKAITSDMDADATAGTVNLVTKKAPEKLEFIFDSRGAYNHLEGALKQYDIYSRAGRRFFDNKLGVQASFDLERKDRTSEQFSQSWQILADSTYELQELGLTYSPETRTRYGASLILDYVLPGGGQIKYNSFFSRTDRDQCVYSRNYPAQTTVTYSFGDHETRIHTFVNSLHGERVLFASSGPKLYWGISHAISQKEKPYSYRMDFGEQPGMENITNPDIFKGPGERLIPFALNDFRNATLSSASFETGTNKEKDLSFKLDLEQNFVFGKFLNGVIKIGGKYRGKDRSRTVDRDLGRYWVVKPLNYQLDGNGNPQLIDFSGTPFQELLMVGGINVSMMNFLPASTESRDLFEKYSLNPLIDKDLVRTWYDLHKHAVNETGTMREYVNDYSVLQNIYDIDEQISAYYAMITLNLSKRITLIGGLRFENESNEYFTKYVPEVSGFLTQKVQVRDTTCTYSSGHYLPNLQLRFRVNDWWDVRLAGFKTLTRPDFSMRLPNLYIHRDGASIVRGNPQLKSAVSSNYELNTSLYHWKYGLLNLGAFYKEIDDMFYNLNNIRVVSRDFSKKMGLPQNYGSLVGFNLDEPQNTDQTKVWGFEVDLQANLGFLPGVLSHFVVNANFSHLRSETLYPRFRVVQDNSTFPPKQTPEFFTSKDKLQGQPENFGNFALGYDLKGFSVRLTYFYQTDYLNSISTISLYDRTIKGFGKWDLALKQRVSENLALFYNLTNLTDFYEGSYYNYKHLDNGSAHYGRIMDFGIRYSFK